MDHAIPIVGQQLLSGVSFRDQNRWLRPSDVENRIQWTEACFGIGMVGGTVQINKLGVVSQRLKTMGKSGRYQKARAVSVLQDPPMPLEERWRPSSNIHYDVKYATLHARDDLRISMRCHLVVHPPEGSS